jgi:hypothetical protein
VGPPGIHVVDHELHHAVLGPFLLKVPLQDEAAGAHLEDGHFTIEDLLEA